MITTPETLTPDTLGRIIHRALLSRKVEERFLDLFSKGKLFGTVHTCIGQEFSGATVCGLLSPGDAVFSNHRCHGHFLSFCGDVEGLIAELMGKSSGVCGGRGGSQHLCKEGFFSNGIQGGIAPVSAGLAFARKLDGQKKIAVVFIGDGTLGEGVLYETLNIASKWNLPLLFVLEDNGCAQSTSQEETLAGDICQRARAFGIATETADTWKWKELQQTAATLMNYVRTEGRPGFLRIQTFRLKAHSKGDDDRPRELIARFEARDPLNLLLEAGNPELKAELREIELRIDRAVEKAEAEPEPKIDPEIEAKLALAETQSTTVQWSSHQPSRKKLGVAINECFKLLMKKDPRLMFIGEDVLSPYGGAFKVSKDLSDLYPGRVLNTPISEAAIVGLGSGLALEGYRPFIEIMFGDFVGLAFDQIVNHAAKFEQMYNHQVKLNLIVRTPMGGRRGYGPTHSQTLDRHFLGVPGLRVLAVNHLIEPALIYETLARGNPGATLVIENKKLYATELLEKAPEGFTTWVSDEMFPSVHLKPSSASVDVTLIGYGGMSEALVKAADLLFEEHDIVAQVFCPTQLYPFDIRRHLPLLAESRSLVLVEEGQGFASFSSEIVSQLLEVDPGLLRRVKRVMPQAMSIPASGAMEREMLPDTEEIVAAALELS